VGANFTLQAGFVRFS